MLKNNKIYCYIGIVTFFVSVFSVGTNKAVTDIELAGTIVSRVGVSIGMVGATVWVGGKTLDFIVHKFDGRSTPKVGKDRVLQVLSNALYIGTAAVLGTYVYANRISIYTTIQQSLEWMMGKDLLSSNTK